MKGEKREIYREELVYTIIGAGEASLNSIEQAIRKRRLKALRQELTLAVHRQNFLFLRGTSVLL